MGTPSTFTRDDVRDILRNAIDFAKHNNGINLSDIDYLIADTFNPNGYWLGAAEEVTGTD